MSHIIIENPDHHLMIGKIQPIQPITIHVTSATSDTSEQLSQPFQLIPISYGNRENSLCMAIYYIISMFMFISILIILTMK